MRKLIQLTVSLLIGGLLLWLSFREVDLGDALSHILALPWWTGVIYLVLLTLTHVLRAERFRLQLSRMTNRNAEMGEAMALFSVGMAATFLIPFRLGEFVRPYLGKVRGHMSMSTGLSTVATERVIDGLTTTAMFGLILLLMRGASLPESVYVAGYAALVVFGGALMVFIVGYRHRGWVVGLIRRVLGVASRGLATKISAMVDRFLAGLNTLPSWRDLLIYEFFTVAYWFINGASMYMLMVAMGIDVGWVASFLVLSCLVVGVMIPAPPGNVGNFEYAVVLPLTALGIPPALAVAYAVVLHLLQATQMTAIALYFVLTGKVTLRRIVEATQGRADPDTSAGSGS